MRRSLRGRGSSRGYPVPSCVESLDFRVAHHVGAEVKR